MQNQAKNPGRTGTLVAAFVFVGIVLIILLIALLNAPTMGGPRVMASLNTYLTEVTATAIPFIMAVGVLAVIIAFLAARELRKVWPNVRHRTELITGYAFLAPYLARHPYFHDRRRSVRAVHLFHPLRYIHPPNLGRLIELRRGFRGLH